jgi:hypothetical protein
MILSILVMDTIPGIADLPEKILTQCGLVTAVSWVIIVWLAAQLAKTNSRREKAQAESDETLKKMIEANGKLEGMIFAMQLNRGVGNDDG